MSAREDWRSQKKHKQGFFHVLYAFMNIIQGDFTVCGGMKMIQPCTVYILRESSILSYIYAFFFS